MLTSWDRSFAKLLEVEGGSSNNAKDPGGMTNLGVGARQWAAFMGQPLSTITKAQMQALTPSSVEPFYRNNYWNLVDGDNLPAGVDAMVFQFEVNAGGISVKLLQRILGVAQDGLAGPKTILATKGYIDNYGIDNLIDALAGAQINYYETLPNWPTFGSGWTSRIDTFSAFASQLAT
jgi:lysozyme family protein